MVEFSNINESHERVLQQIRLDVKSAFEQRRRVVTDTTLKGIVDVSDRNKEAKVSLQHLSDDDMIRTISVEGSHLAIVENSHDFPFLIQAAYELMVEQGLLSKEEYTPEKIHQSVQGCLKHEYEHHAVAIGYDGLKVTYRVEFLEDPKLGLIGFRPLIQLEGNLTWGHLKSIHTAPEELSLGDKAYQEF